jgi:hypothetical protein
MGNTHFQFGASQIKRRRVGEQKARRNKKNRKANR